MSTPTETSTTTPTTTSITAPATAPGLVSVPPAAVGHVERRVHALCLRYARRLPFHGWHHVSFVRDKAVEFATLNGSDVPVVETAALVHDVNYLVRRNSTAAAGSGLRMAILAEAGIRPAVAEWVDALVDEAEMRTRDRDISLEAQALSDADTLFKALPVTPVVLAHRYLSENGVSLRELADKIVGEQRAPLDEGFYFYSPAAAAAYSRWATANLELWRCIKESLDDPTVERLLTAVA
ncbi:HD family phosphohydrolase [Actinokineospora inagensis]|uniref:HD family phosphohydrolase n=1 Tax=Actinokineospora inagensis TaxID=103730 RepID=UPI0003F88C9F|nr:HD family phosphohydrolase [Actinokineospora inagensis]